MNLKFRCLPVGIVVAVTIAVLGWQQSTAGSLRTEIDRARENVRTLAALTPDLTVASQTERAEKESGGMSVSTAALEQVRAEIVTLRREVEEAERTKLENAATLERFAVGRTLVAAEWRNSGTATMEAALETALWAGAGGDVETFARTLLFSNRTTLSAAQALRERMPEQARALYDSPERVLAFLAMKDLPLGAVQVRRVDDASPDDPRDPRRMRHVQLLMTTTDRRQKEVSLVLINPGDGAGWKLYVTEPVVAKYAAMLKEMNEE